MSLASIVEKQMLLTVSEPCCCTDRPSSNEVCHFDESKADEMVGDAVFDLIDEDDDPQTNNSHTRTQLHRVQRTPHARPRDRL